MGASRSGSMAGQRPSAHIGACPPSSVCVHGPVAAQEHGAHIAASEHARLCLVHTCSYNTHMLMHMLMHMLLAALIDSLPHNAH
jgi:hypothetical protein